MRTRFGGKRVLSFFLTLCMMSSMVLTSFADEPAESLPEVLQEVPAEVSEEVDQSEEIKTAEEASAVSVDSNDEALDAAIEPVVSDPVAPVEADSDEVTVASSETLTEAADEENKDDTDKTLALDSEVVTVSDDVNAGVLADETEEVSEEKTEDVSVLEVYNAETKQKEMMLLSVTPGTVTVSSVDPSAKAIVVNNQITYSVKVVSSASYYLKYTWFKDGGIVAEGTSTTDTIALTPTVAGTYKLQVEAYNKDVDAWQSTATSADTVVVQEAFSFTAVEVNATEISLGNAISFKPNARGGSGNVDVTHYVYKDGTLITTNNTTTSTEYIYVPTETGSYYCTTTIKDNLFGTVITQTSPTVTVKAALSITSITPSALLLNLGSALSYNVVVTGGIEPYKMTYRFFLNSAENDVVAGTTSTTYSNTPVIKGIYYLEVTAEDSAGNSITSTSGQTEIIDAVTVSEVKPNYTVIATNDTLNVTVTCTGSPSKYYYEVTRDGEVVYSEEKTSNSFSYVPTIAGSYTVRVTAIAVSSIDSQITLKAQGTSATVTVKEQLVPHGVSTESTVYTLGSPITFKSVYSGGIAPIDFVYRVYKKVSGSWQQVAMGSNQTGSYTYTPSSVGEYYCEIGIKDTRQSTYMYNNSDTVEVIQEIVFDKVSVNNTKVPVGTNIVFTPVISGGTENYKFIYCVFNSKEQLTMVSSTALSYSYTPTVADKYYCVVYAADDRNIWKHVSSETVNVISSITSVTASLDKYAAYKNESVTVTANTVGQAVLYCYRVYDNSGAKVHEAFTNANTFSFKPTTTGTYKVEVLAYDQINWTAATPITLNVYEPFSYTQVYLSRLSGKVGDSISMATDAKNGIPAIQYIYCVYLETTQLVMNQTSATNYTYTFTQPGSYRIAIYAADQKGQWVVHDVKWIVVQNTLPFAITDIKVNPTTANIGGTINYTVTTSNPATNYIYCVFRNGQQVTMTYSTSSSFSYSVTSGGTYSITVYATDGKTWVHQTAADVTNVTDNVFAITAVTPASTSVSLGSSIQFTTTTSGAVGAVKYIHCLFKGTTQLTMDNSNSASYSFTPTSSGNYHLEEYATDDRGIWVKRSSVEVIVSDAPALKLNVTVSSTDLNVNDTLTVKPNATGGNGAYKYIYCVFRGDTQLTMDQSTSSSYTYKLTSAGTYRVVVYCTDANPNNWIRQESTTIIVH